MFNVHTHSSVISNDYVVDLEKKQKKLDPFINTCVHGQMSELVEVAFLKKIKIHNIVVHCTVKLDY